MTQTRSDDATANFTNGLSCSQAVCRAFAEYVGIDRETALKLSSAIRGGVAHSGHRKDPGDGALF
jgi:hypothetical protein